MAALDKEIPQPGELADTLLDKPPVPPRRPSTHVETRKSLIDALRYVNSDQDEIDDFVRAVSRTAERLLSRPYHLLKDILGTHVHQV